jgi:hypothetical protein
MRRSAKALIGYAIRATDGEFGKVDEFYFDDHEWTVRYEGKLYDWYGQPK